jgi:hypothetical protein
MRTLGERSSGLFRDYRRAFQHIVAVLFHLDPPLAPNDDLKVLELRAKVGRSAEI